MTALSDRGQAAQVPALADSTIQRIFSVVRLVLDGAVRDGLIAKSPAADIKPPALPTKEARFLPSTEVGRLLAEVRGTRYEAILTFIAATGVRKGEALALTWPDVDFAGEQIKIRATLARIQGKLVSSSPKTTRSRRTLPLTPGMAALLKTCRANQLAEQDHAQSLWQEGGFVFTTETGTPLEPRNVLRALTSAASRAGLTGVSVHTLRHSAATAMLEAGVHLKAVSEILGHSDIRITGDVYGHVSTEVAKAAMDSLSKSLGY
ncbi:MAG: site-specific integrase [Cellulomonas sp.]|nr:site-specific integrase [Cellulomonas sp.]